MPSAESKVKILTQFSHKNYLNWKCLFLYIYHKTSNDMQRYSFSNPLRLKQHFLIEITYCSTESALSAFSPQWFNLLPNVLFHILINCLSLLPVSLNHIFQNLGSPFSPCDMVILFTQANSQLKYSSVNLCTLVTILKPFIHHFHPMASVCTYLSLASVCTYLSLNVNVNV